MRWERQVHPYLVKKSSQLTFFFFQITFWDLTEVDKDHLRLLSFWRDGWILDRPIKLFKVLFGEFFLQPILREPWRKSINENRSQNKNEKEILWIPSQIDRDFGLWLNFDWGLICRDAVDASHIAFSGESLFGDFLAPYLFKCKVGFGIFYLEFSENSRAISKTFKKFLIGLWKAELYREIAKSNTFNVPRCEILPQNLSQKFPS